MRLFNVVNFITFLQHLYYINSNTITNYTTRPDFVGNQTVSQNNSAIIISPADIYTYTTFISSTAPIQNQTITFNALASQPYSLNGVINLTGSSNSGLSVTYSSSDTNVVDVSGSTLSIKGVGQATITASQAGNVNYNAATSVSRTQEITAVPPTLTNFYIPDKKNVDKPFQITHPTSNSTGPYSYESSDTSVVTVSGSTLIIKGVGQATITATQAAAGNYTIGSTIATIHNGIDYSPVFDAEYYLNRYPDLRLALGNNPSAAFNHFITNGRSES